MNFRPKKNIKENMSYNRNVISYCHQLCLFPYESLTVNSFETVMKTYYTIIKHYEKCMVIYVNGTDIYNTV